MSQEAVNMTAEGRARYSNSVFKRVGSVIEVDNSTVVPTNLAMLFEYRTHACLEYVGSSCTSPLLPAVLPWSPSN
jgi:hypothetical protein